MSERRDSKTSAVKYLAKNVGFLTISQFGTKLLSFFLVPLYTSILSTSDYGTYDLVYSTVSILIPLLTINIFDAVLRFSIDDTENRKDIFSIACKYFILGNLIVALGLIINRLLNFSSLVNDFALFFVLIFFVQSALGILTAFARGLDCVLDLSISGVICSAFIIGGNIFFLCVCKIGLAGYFWANIIGPLVQIVYLSFRIKVWKYIKRVEICFSEYEKKMIAYSAPMIANTIAWWVNSVSDRYVVLYYCGLGVTGIYSVASKIPSIINIFQTIFNQAWTLSAVKDFDPNDENGFFSKMYNSYNALMVIICSILILGSRFLATFLYKGGFYEAWICVPFLLMAVVFGSLSGYVGGIFTAVKNTKIFAKSTVIGAIVNLLFNIILVPVFGAIGAAIATTISYFVVYYMRVRYMKSYISIKMNLKRDYLSYSLLIIQSFLLIVIKQDNGLVYSIETLLLAFVIFLYSGEIKTVIERIKH